MTLVDRCVFVSDHPPAEWPEEVIHPLPGKTVSIFGHHQVAMARDRNIKLIEALVWTGLCASNGIARGMIRSGAVMVNRVRVTDIDCTLSASDALPNLDAVVIEAGKRNYGIIELCD